MADSGESRPPEPAAQPEPADLAANAGQPELAGDGPQVHAGEPTRREKRKSSRRKKTDSSAWITAVISALAALMGALVGGISSYVVAQSTSTAEADAAQIARRETTYADYITDESDLLRSYGDLADHFRLNPGDRAEWDAMLKTEADIYTKWLHTDFIVRVVESPGVDQARQAIFDHNLKIKNLWHGLRSQVDNHEPINQHHLQGLYSEISGMTSFLDAFTKAAQADLVPPKRGLFS